MKKLLRKIHLWLSVPFGIIITLICFSGASLVFEKEISALWDAEERLPFFDTMFHLHRWLLGPSRLEDGSMPLGKLLVGISTLMLVIILITGLLMWLTNRHKPLVKSLQIHVRSGWPRFWHDLHVAGGIYATIFLLLMALTGLTWSFSWYRTGFYSMMGVEALAMQRPQGGAHGGGHGGHGGGGRSHGGQRSRQVTSDQQKAPGTTTALEEKATDAAQVAEGAHASRGAQATEAAQERAQQVRSLVYHLHNGSWGGLVTRILAFLAALLGATLPLTGYYLWIRRLILKGNSHQPHGH